MKILSAPEPERKRCRGCKIPIGHGTLCARCLAGAKAHLHVQAALKFMKLAAEDKS
jgi:hypothetical protein